MTMRKLCKWLYLMLAFVVHYGIGVESVVVLPVEQCVKGSSERAWQPLQYVISPTLHVKLVFRIQLVIHINFVDGGTACRQRGMITTKTSSEIDLFCYLLQSLTSILILLSSRKRTEIAKIMNWEMLCNAKKGLNFSNIQINSNMSAKV